MYTLPRVIDIDLLQTELLDALLAGQSAQGIVDCAHRVIRMPIIAFDPEFRVLAFAFERPCYYGAWEEIACNQGTAQYMEYLPNQERIFRHGRSLLFDHADDPDIWFGEVACALMVGDHLVGYVGTIIEDGDAQNVLQANDLLAASLSYHYSLAAKRKNTEEPGQAELLDVFFSVAPARDSLEAIKRRTAAAYVFAVAESDRHSIADLQFVCGTYCRGINCVFGCVSEGQLRMLLWGQSPGDLPWIAVALDNIGLSMGIRCGVSDVFDQLGELPTYRLQALAVLRAGRQLAPEGRVHLCTESAPLLIAAAARDRLGQDALLPAEIQELIAADQAEGTHNIATLRALLQNRGGATKTARALGIHCNTLNYRLQKIQDCIRADLKDPQVLFRLQTGLEMLGLRRPDGTWG